jgi:hypothetical protein
VPKIIDYGQFHHRLAAATDRYGRWQLLREFQREWRVKLSGAEAFEWVEEARERLDEMRDNPQLRAELADDDDFDDVDLDLPIPAAVDEWWDLDFNSFVVQPRLYWTHPAYPPMVRPDPSGFSGVGGLQADHPVLGGQRDTRVCVFMYEYQECNSWGYLAAHADQPDPAAFVAVARDRWEVQSRSVSEFFLQLAVIRIPRATGWTTSATLSGGDVPAVLRAAGYEPLGFLPWLELAAHTTAYGAPDTIVFHNAGNEPELYACARSRGALDRLPTATGITWSEPTPPRWTKV